MASVQNVRGRRKMTNKSKPREMLQRFEAKVDIVFDLSEFKHLNAEDVNAIIIESLEDKTRIILSCGGGMPPGVSTENLQMVMTTVKDVDG